MNSILNHIPNLKHLDSGMFFVMAGPCVVENEEVMMRVAEKACAVTDALRIPYILKPLIARPTARVWTPSAVSATKRL